MTLWPKRVVLSAAIVALLALAAEPVGNVTAAPVRRGPAAAPERVLFPPHWAVTGTGGMVVSAHPLATQAGLTILRAGGNAIDALLAVQWALTLVEPQSSGIGGGAFLLYYRAHSKSIHALDGRETAPKAMRPNVFLGARGRIIPFYPDRITGGRPVGVPGTVALMDRAQRAFGGRKVTWADTFGPAAQLARSGFRASPRLALSTADHRDRLARFPASRKLYLPHGRPVEEGARFSNPDLARTFTLLARQGPSIFYSGAIARDIVAAVRKSPVAPGVLSMQDLADYRVVERRAIESRFRTFRLVTMPPPSSGVILLQSLAILDGFSREQVRQSNPLGVHLKLEAEKLAFADREVYVYDPGVGKDPTGGLLAPGYVAERRGLISLEKAIPAPAQPGRPPGMSARRGEQSFRAGLSTTQITIVDAEGNVVACTSTIEHGFGSAIIVPGRGFVLNNELTDFSPMPGSINGPQPGRRPRSSMSPTMVFSGDRFVLALGSPGGPFIPGSVSAVLLGVLNDGLSLQDALNAPRALHRNDLLADLELELYRRSDLRGDLERRGHRLRPPAQTNPAFGSVQAILRDTAGILWGASDPRREGKAGVLTAWP